MIPKYKKGDIVLVDNAVEFGEVLEVKEYKDGYYEFKLCDERY